MAKIITLTGIDGSGKTTHAYLLAKALSSKFKCKVKVIYGGNAGLKLGIGRRKYSFYLSLPIDIIVHRILGRDHDYIYKNYPKLAKLETFLLAIDYLLFTIPKVIFYSKLYDVVITDRYVYDSLVIFIAGNAYIKVLTILRKVTPKPDLTILLDVNERVAYIRKNGEKNLYELKLLRKIYLAFAEKMGWKKVNANRTLSMVYKDLWNLVISTLNFRCRS